MCRISWHITLELGCFDIGLYFENGSIQSHNKLLSFILGDSLGFPGYSL